MKESFLDIFKQQLHKIDLKQVKLVSKQKNFGGKTYYKFVGKFSLVPPNYFNNDFINSFLQNKNNIINELQKIKEQKSNCITHKYTKKLKFNGKVKEKIGFCYVFDVVPKNIIDFQFQNEKLILYVIGWGIKK